MNSAERSEAFKKFVAEQTEILEAKNKDYSAGNSDKDANYNFRLIAEIMDGAPWTPYSVAMVYKLKHVLSMIAFAKTGKVESEGIHGRHHDDANYTFIMDLLAKDHTERREEKGKEKVDWVEPVYIDEEEKWLYNCIRL